MALTERFRKLIQPPPSVEAARQRRAWLIGVIVATSSFILIVLAVAELLANPGSYLELYVVGGILIFQACIWLVQRRAGTDRAGRLMAFGYWLIVCLAGLFSGGLHSSALFAQIISVVIVGLVLGRREALMFALFTVIFNFGLMSLQATDSLPIAWLREPLDMRWAIHSTIMIMAAALIYFAERAIGQALQVAQDREQFYRSMVDKTNDAVFTVDLDRKIIAINQRAADLLGYQAKELIGRPYEDLVPREERDQVSANFEELKKMWMTPLFERTLIRKDGSHCRVEFNASTVRDGKGVLLYYQGVARDLTERKRLEEELHYALKQMETLAMQDSLTGLLNRRAITQYARAEWNRAQREGNPMAVVLIDLDNLKRLNDLKGHEAGDMAILELVKIIGSSKRSYDWAGRWGGDEFLLILPNTGLKDARNVAERLRVRLKKNKLQLEAGEEIEMQVSLGVASQVPIKDAPGSPNDLIALADQAMLQAKRNGRDQVSIAEKVELK